MSHEYTKKNTPGQDYSGIYPIYKDRGETLATLLERFRQERGLGAETKLTYAGRLDPMAEGLVIVLADELRHKKDSMLGLPKTYEVEILLGVSTDTYDTLGLVTKSDFHKFQEGDIIEAIEGMKDVVSLPYPMYSSVPVEGLPLFSHARAGNVVEVPEKNVRIFEAKLLDITIHHLNVLVAESIEVITKVAGDFRQDDIISLWKRIIEKFDGQEVQMVRVLISASSGAYMRSLAQWLGERLRVPALAYKIKRTEIGDYKL